MGEPEAAQALAEGAQAEGYLMPSMTLTEARLRVALAGWPDVGPEAAAFMAALPWRRRQAAVLYLVEERTLQEVGAALAVHHTTVGRDLRAVLQAWGERC